MKRTLIIGAILSSGLLAYLLLWPVPIKPVPLTVSTGKTPIPAARTPDTALESAHLLTNLQGVGPEDVAMGADGQIFTGLEDGRVVSIDPVAGRMLTIAKAPARVLGLRVAPDGTIYAAASDAGLISIRSDGSTKVILSEVDSHRINLADGLVMASNGAIFFTDASYRWKRNQILEELLEHRPYGRLIRYDPKSLLATVVARDLYFANGVALSPDESYALVCESTASRVRRIWLTGARAGQMEIFVDNLPGYPDNVSAGVSSAYWIALPQPQVKWVSITNTRPWLAKLLYRLPINPIWLARRAPRVLGVDAAGIVQHNYGDTNGKFASITSILEHRDRLYFGSLGETSILEFEPADFHR